MIHLIFNIHISHRKMINNNYSQLLSGIINKLYFMSNKIAKKVNKFYCFCFTL